MMEGIFIDIFRIAYHELNERSEDYKIGQLQHYRDEIQDISRPNTYKIFSKRSIKHKKNYAYHSGGRKEIQVNIGFEPDEEKFRAGYAFSFQTSNHVFDLVDILKPKVMRFNQFLTENYDKYSDLSMFYHDEIDVRSDNYQIEEIGENLIKKDYFIFFGKFYDKKQGDSLSDEEYDDILKLLSKMLEMYFYVETGDEKYL